MAKTIQQTVKFSAPPDRLYDIYMDSKKHGADGRVARINRGWVKYYWNPWRAYLKRLR